MLGSATVPVANFILGATIGAITGLKWPKLYDLLVIIGIKFIAIPLVVFLLLLNFNLDSGYPVLAGLLVIESASAPAASIILQVNNYGGDAKLGGAIMVITYVISLIAIPMWLTLWNLNVL
jgi:predicted permease